MFGYCYCFCSFSWLTPSLVCEIPLLRCLLPLQFKIYSGQPIFHVFDPILMQKSNERYSNFPQYYDEKMPQSRETFVPN